MCNWSEHDMHVLEPAQPWVRVAQMIEIGLVRKSAFAAEAALVPRLSVAAMDISCSSALRALASAAATRSSACCSFSSAKLRLPSQ